jgi:hypothetical protein
MSAFCKRNTVLCSRHGAELETMLKPPDSNWLLAASYFWPRKWLAELGLTRMLEVHTRCELLTRMDPADTISASAARYLIRSKFLPLAGAARSLTLRQVQHSK